MLEAVFTANVDEIKVSGLTQWDRGQLLKITCPGLPAAFQVHFTNRARDKAIPVQAVAADNVTTIAIPDEILCEPFEVLAHLYFTEGDAGLIGETVKTLRMPLTPRAQPEDYVVDLTREQLSEAERVIQKMLGDTATEAAEAAAKGALSSIQNALDNLPEGDTLIINDLTTGGATAALSAEMGKKLAQKPSYTRLSLENGFEVQRGCRYFKTVYGFVTVVGEAMSTKDNGGITGDNMLIATLPEGFRPDAEYSYPATWWFEGTSTTSAKRVPGAVVIATNGTIKARIIPQDIVSGTKGNFFFFATFRSA